MKAMTNLAGILLIVFGAVTLAYHGFTYTKPEKVAQIGPLEVTSNTEKTVYFPPILSGLCLAAGIVLVVVGRR